MSIFGAQQFKTGGNNSSASSVALASTLNTAIGDLISVCVGYADTNGRTITGVTDTAGNTYAPRTAFGPSGGNQKIQFWDCISATHANAANTVTATFSGAISGNANICAWDVTISGGTVSFDVQSGQAPAGASAAPAVPAFSTTGTDEVLFVAEISPSLPSATASAGMTLDSGTFDSHGQADSAAEHAQFTSVQTNITPGFTNPGNQFYGIAAVAYAGTSVDVSSVAVVPSSVTFPATGTGTVTLNNPAPGGGQVVTLASTDPTIATVPASVTVLAGQTTANFTVTSLNKAGTTQIQATVISTVQTPFTVAMEFFPITDVIVQYNNDGTAVHVRTWAYTARGQANSQTGLITAYDQSYFWQRVSI